MSAVNFPMTMERSGSATRVACCGHLCKVSIATSRSLSVAISRNSSPRYGHFRMMPSRLITGGPDQKMAMTGKLLCSENALLIN